MERRFRIADYGEDYVPLSVNQNVIKKDLRLEVTFSPELRVSSCCTLIFKAQQQFSTIILSHFRSESHQLMKKWSLPSKKREIYLR